MGLIKAAIILGGGYWAVNKFREHNQNGPNGQYHGGCSRGQRGWNRNGQQQQGPPGQDTKDPNATWVGTNNNYNNDPKNYHENNDYGYDNMRGEYRDERPQQYRDEKPPMQLGNGNGNAPRSVSGESGWEKVGERGLGLDRDRKSAVVPPNYEFEGKTTSQGPGPQEGQWRGPGGEFRRMGSMEKN